MLMRFTSQLIEYFDYFTQLLKIIHNMSIYKIAIEASFFYCLILHIKNTENMVL